MDDKHEPHIIPFATRLGSGNGQESSNDDEQVAPGNAYALVRGTRLPPALRFRCLDGRSFAMPYAHHPIIWGESAALLLLEYPRSFTVILAGHDLGTLETFLCERRVLWIRECSEADATRLPVAVTRIERMHRYPSRELL